MKPQVPVDGAYSQENLSLLVKLISCLQIFAVDAPHKDKTDGGHFSFPWDTPRFSLYVPLLEEPVLMTHVTDESGQKPQQLLSLPLFPLSPMTQLVCTMHVGLINSIFHCHCRLNSLRPCSHRDDGKSLV